tara:strand:+ start:4345 stop:4668 length:324 start_codon:yes stop_codon:yes gene_type:complete
MKQRIILEVELDENKLPVDIEMQTNNEDKVKVIKALMFSAWQAEKKETLRVDLWTKDMPVNDMFIMNHQTLIGMANSLERATGNTEIAEGLRDYCAWFAKKTNILKT